MNAMKSDSHPYNACIMGAPLDTGNMGVSALAVSLIKIIGEIRPDAKIILLVGGRYSGPREIVLSGKKYHIQIINYRLSPKAQMREHLFCIVVLAVLYRIVPCRMIRNALSKWCPWLAALIEADFIGDIRGGDSFSDIYGLSRIIIGSLPPLTALLLKKRLILLPQTYGPYRTKMAQMIARYFFSRSSYILSRDRESMEHIDTFLGSERAKKDVRLCPDVAFLLDSCMPNDTDIRPSLKNRIPDEPLIGLNVNGLLYHGGYTRDNMFRLNFDYKLFMNRLTDRMLQNTKARIVLIPHTFAYGGDVESDNNACHDVLRRVADDRADRIHMVSGTYDQSAIKGIIGQCDFFIGSRMHACIAALSQGIPAVAVAYSKKFRGVYDSIGVTDLVIDAQSCDLETSINRICTLFDDRAEVTANLRPKVNEATQQIWDIFRSILDGQQT
jgi:polysaccharide pyruvyl transferase WcaK-like protein